MTIRALAVAFLSLLIRQEPEKDPATIFAEKVASIYKTLGRKHNEIGGFLSNKKQYQWAFREYEKSLNFDPDHSNTRQKLGFKKVDSGWEKDPNIKVKTTNEEDDEDKAAKIGIDYSKKLNELGESVGKMWADAAKFADAKGKEVPELAEEAEKAWRNAIVYDPNQADARKKFGFEKVKPSNDAASVKWQSKKMIDFLKEMKGSVAAAAKGADATSEMFCDKVGVTLKKKSAEHFLIGAPHMTPDRLSVVIQYAEATHTMYSKLFGSDQGIIRNPVQMVIYKDKSEHEKYCDTFEKDPTRRDFMKKCSGSVGVEAHEKYQGDAPDGTIDDGVVHSATHSCVGYHIGMDRSWVTEGLAYILSRGIHGTADNSCTNLGDTSAKGPKKNFKSAEKWRGSMRELVEEMNDPPIDAVMKAETKDLTGDKTVKGWSILEYLMHDHTEKFVEFISELGRSKDDKSGEEALKRVFDWTPAELEDRWRAYVRATYP